MKHYYKFNYEGKDISLLGLPFFSDTTECQHYEFEMEERYTDDTVLATVGENFPELLESWLSSYEGVHEITYEKFTADNGTPMVKFKVFGIKQHVSQTLQNWHNERVSKALESPVDSRPLDEFIDEMRGKYSAT